MWNRYLGLLLTGAMLIANAGIFVNDVLPRWAPDDAPPTDAQLLAPDETRQVQVGIFRADGQRIGKSWTRSSRRGGADLVYVATTTVLGPIALPSATVPRVRIETELTYRGSTAQLDDLDFRMYGLGTPVQLVGEAMDSGEFAFRWRVGPERGSYLIRNEYLRSLGDVIRPFDRLANLSVGQSWRVKLLDPVSQMLPNLGAEAIELEPVLIRVTRTERMEHRGEAVQAFVVEGGSARAYVHPDGRVLRQVVNVPLLGELHLIDEAFDENERIRSVGGTP